MPLPRLLPDRTTFWSALSGVVLAAAFPRPDFAFLAWGALIPLCLVMERRPFRSGFAAGIGFFAPVLYWVNIVMTTYGKMHPVLSVVAYLLLVAYLALFFGAATWVTCRLREKSGRPVALTLPVAWVALEFLRSFLLSGFPWALLGYSQQSVLPLIQSADLFGVYGLSFLLVLVNAVAAASIRSAAGRSPGGLPKAALLLILVLFAGNLGYGYWRLGQDLDGRARQLRTAVVQGNIDQDIKWDPAFEQVTLDTYRRLSLAADGGEGAELVVWPESATPFYFQEENAQARSVREVPRQTGAYLLFGSPAYVRENRQTRFLNSAYLLSPAGETLGRSDKVHLVPFGEYVPFAPFLPFIDKLVVGIGDFTPGTVSPLPLNGSRIGVLVCFEAIFPELARDFVRQGSDLLVNITNDAWFGRSSAPYQHLAMTRFRAVENRIWLARAANTGISAFIAPSGRIMAASPLFEPLFLTAPVGLGAGSALYTRLGDILPVVSLLLCLGWLVQTRRRLGRR